MVAASAHLERSLVLYRMERFDEAAAAARVALDLFDGLRRDYPDEPSVLRLHGASANTLALLHNKKNEWAEARPLLEAACEDQARVLARNPKDAEATEFLTNHRRSLAVCLYELDDLAALEPVARALGQMAGQQSSYWAAVGLLRCAEPDETAKARALRDEAVDLLVESNRRGRRIDADDPRLSSVRNDPRLQQIAVRKPGG
jgi:tetratricopeptide (TPR) repeat protein